MAKILHAILQWPPVQLVRRWSKRWKPPGFQGVSLHAVLRYIGKNFSVPNLTESASAMSFNFLMSIPPTLLFIFTIIPNLPFLDKNEMKQQLQSLIKDIIPAAVYNRGLLEFVNSFIEGTKIGLLSFTFILSLLFASNGVMGLIRSFNKKDLMGFEEIKGLRRRWEAIKLTLMLFTLLLLCLLLLLVQKNILDWLGIDNKELLNLILYGKWILLLGLIFSTFAFIYRYAPSTTKRWKLFSPGAVIATLLSILVSIGFTFFVENFGQYNVLYGSIGTILIVMVMVFLNSLAIFIGYILNLSIHMLKLQQEERKQKLEINDS